MAEANELFEGWSFAPPTNLLLKAVIEGFAGKPVEGVDQNRLDAASGAIANVTDAQLTRLSVEAGPALPVQRSKDLGLPKVKPVFDIDELRKKNRDIFVSAALRNKAIGRK